MNTINLLVTSFLVILLVSFLASLSWEKDSRKATRIVQWELSWALRFTRFYLKHALQIVGETCLWACNKLK